MQALISGRRSVRLAATLSFLELAVPAAWAAESRAVADLLAQPAQANTMSVIQALNDEDFKIVPRKKETYFTGDAVAAEAAR